MPLSYWPYEIEMLKGPQLHPDSKMSLDNLLNTQLYQWEFLFKRTCVDRTYEVFHDFYILTHGVE